MKKIFLFSVALFALAACSVGEVKTDDAVSQESSSPISDESVAQETEKEIIAVGSENSWAFDVSDPKEVFRRTDVAIRIRVNSVDEYGLYPAANFGRPVTGVQVEVLDVLAGETDLGETTIYQYGALLPARLEIERSDEGRIKKLEWDKWTDEQMDITIFDYRGEEYFKFILGEEYVVATAFGEDGCLYLGASGYNVFEISKADDTSFLNVLTGNEITLDEILYAK